MTLNKIQEFRIQIHIKYKTFALIVFNRSHTHTHTHRSIRVTRALTPCGELIFYLNQPLLSHTCLSCCLFSCQWKCSL